MDAFDRYPMQYEAVYICILDKEIIIDPAHSYTDLEGNLFHNQEEADQYWRGNDFMEQLGKDVGMEGYKPWIR